MFKIKKNTLILTIGLALLFLLALIFYLIFKNPISKSSILFTSKTVELSGQEKVDSLLLAHLKIPKINVDAVIEQAGLTSDGAMDVPKGPSETAWYKFGPRPGEIGSAVIDGHSGWKNNIPAVFDNLYKLEIGDKIYVEDEKEVTTTFVVREIRKYNPNADATDVFSSNDGKAHLNLITCTGFWNKIWKTHSDRLVVFTDKEILYKK